MSEEIKKILSNMLHIIIKYSDDFDELEENEIRYQLPYKQMEKLYDYITSLQQKVEQLENIKKEAIEYLTSYESISTIQGLNDIEKNKILDEKTMNEMVNRYLKVHDILLNILNKGDNK